MLYHLFGHPMSPIFGWILTINYNPHHCCARSIYVWCIPKYPRALNTVKGYHSLDLKYVYIVVYLCKNHVHIYIYDINIYCICNQNTLIICHEQKILRRYMNPADDRYCPPEKKTICHQSISKLDHIQPCIINTAMKYPTTEPNWWSIVQLYRFSNCWQAWWS